MATRPKKSRPSIIRLNRKLPRWQPVLWFKHGMLFASSLNPPLSAHEADGAFVLKQAIRASAEKLKKLPKGIKS